MKVQDFKLVKSRRIDLSGTPLQLSFQLQLTSEDRLSTKPMHLGIDYLLDDLLRGYYEHIQVAWMLEAIAKRLREIDEKV